MEIAEKCQEFHNLKKDWYDSNYQFSIESQSIFSGNNKERINLVIDNQNQTFQYTNAFRGVDLIYKKDTCIALNDSSSCDSYYWTKNFHPYIWGLPCKFFDKGTIIEPSVKDTTINQQAVYVVHVNYEKEGWDYYINKKSFNLEGFKFVQRQDKLKGEIVLNEGQIEHNGLIIPTKRTWYDLKNNKLGTDILIQNE